MGSIKTAATPSNPTFSGRLAANGAGGELAMTTEAWPGLPVVMPSLATTTRVHSSPFLATPGGRSGVTMPVG